jgi:hypothetical protein
MTSRAPAELNDQVEQMVSALNDLGLSPDLAPQALWDQLMKKVARPIGKKLGY